MKKFFFIAIISIFMCSCGIGTYSHSSGIENECGLSFVANKDLPISVTVDNQVYNINTVKLKQYKKNRKIKKTTENTITLAPGQHDVKAVMDGKEVFSKTIFLSGNEVKIIELY